VNKPLNATFKNNLQCPICANKVDMALTLSQPPLSPLTKPNPQANLIPHWQNPVPGLVSWKQQRHRRILAVFLCLAFGRLFYGGLGGAAARLAGLLFPVDQLRSVRHPMFGLVR